MCLHCWWWHFAGTECEVRGVGGGRSILGDESRRREGRGRVGKGGGAGPWRRPLLLLLPLS